jgi:hypothetical protein
MMLSLAALRMSGSGKMRPKYLAKPRIAMQTPRTPENKPRGKFIPGDEARFVTWQLAMDRLYNGD